MNRALRPIAMFMETMMVHRRWLILPFMSRSKVRAKDVLLHTAARIESVPMTLPCRLMGDRF
jgi:hypothetical protein